MENSLKTWDELGESERSKYTAQAEYLINGGFCQSSNVIDLAMQIHLAAEKESAKNVNCDHNLHK